MANKEYFSHDYNTRNKIRLAAIIHDYKMTGYGLFWVIAEMLHEGAENWMGLDQLSFISIAKESGCEVEFVKEFIGKCISDYKVFIEKDGKFTTERVLRNIEKREDIKQKKSAAGKSGGIKSGESRRTKQTRSKSKQWFNNGEANEANKRKGKEKKEESISANALVGSGEPPQEPQRDLKSEYKTLTAGLVGKDAKEAWSSVTGFIRDNSPDFIEPYAEAWNIFAKAYKLSALKDINESRRRKFATRIREPSFDFLKILESVKVSPHLKGDNSGGWKINFNWILENDSNYLKILEGNYN